MRIIEPEYIKEAWEEVLPYIVEDENHKPVIRSDAPYYIKDAYLALKRRDQWVTEIAIFGNYQHRLDDV